MAIRGRHWVLLWLAVFMAVAVVVLSRQTRALALARTLTDARAERQALEAEAADLERRVRLAEGADAIEAAAARLGLRAATGSEVTFIVAPNGASSR